MKYDKFDSPDPWEIPGDIKFIKESWEDYPRGGFIEDVILYQKGYETTNFLSFWTAVHYLSSIIMRDAWLRWAHGGMYPNFYTLMVAPPGLVKKSTTIHGLEKVEEQAKKLYVNPVFRFKKANVVIRGKATPEAIFASLANEILPVEIGQDETGDPVFEDVEKNANLIIRVSELSTFLSSAKYNVALVDKLTDFYDCKDNDSDTTIGRGNIELKNVFCTMMGATTPDTLATTIPKEAFGGGFISRSLILKEDYTERIFPEPVAWPELPDTRELAERLAWIGMYKRGEFHLDGDAYDYYAEWYTKNKLNLRKSVMDGETMHENNRRDIHVLKLAHILSIQEYRISQIIRLEHVKTAIKIINYTIDRTHELLEMTSASTDMQKLTTVSHILMKKLVMDRKQMISSVYRKGINTTDLHQCLCDLFEAGKIEVYRDSKIRRNVSRDSKEVYKWVIG
jgi:hypothetical protein